VKLLVGVSKHLADFFLELGVLLEHLLGELFSVVFVLVLQIVLECQFEPPKCLPFETGCSIFDLLGLVDESFLVLEQVGPHLDKPSRESFLTSVVLGRCLHLGLTDVVAAKHGVLLLELGDASVGLLEQLLNLGHRHGGACYLSLECGSSGCVDGCHGERYLQSGP
jgi:hypothetical protein